MRVPVQRKLDAGAKLRDRLKEAGDGLGSQVVADLVGSLSASHQNSAALFAELKEARGLLKTISKSAVEGHAKPGCDGWRAIERCRQVGNLSRTFLARSGKGEG